MVVLAVLVLVSMSVRICISIQININIGCILLLNDIFDSVSVRVCVRALV